jgi:hypothetical protein
MLGCKKPTSNKPANGSWALRDMRFPGGGGHGGGVTASFFATGSAARFAGLMWGRLYRA